MTFTASVGDHIHIAHLLIYQTRPADASTFELSLVLFRTASPLSSSSRRLSENIRASQGVQGFRQLFSEIRKVFDINCRSILVREHRHFTAKFVIVCLIPFPAGKVIGPPRILV